MQRVCVIFEIKLKLRVFGSIMFDVFLTFHKNQSKTNYFHDFWIKILGQIFVDVSTFIYACGPICMTSNATLTCTCPEAAEMFPLHHQMHNVGL